MTAARRLDPELDLDFTEKAGFMVGKSAAIADWQFRKEQNDPSFQRLVWRLQARKYWRAKNPVSKARIVEYRKQWARDHPEEMRAIFARARKKYRGDPKKHARELAAKRAKFALRSQAMRAATVYTCVVCGSYWSPVGRIPTRPPKYCGVPHRAKANHERGKAAGKAWALRSKHRDPSELPEGVVK